MSEYTIRVDARGDLDLLDSYGELVIWWSSEWGKLSVGVGGNQYKHLHRKPCTEAHALLILNQIKRELENAPER